MATYLKDFKQAALSSSMNANTTPVSYGYGGPTYGSWQGAANAAKAAGAPSYGGQSFASALSGSGGSGSGGGNYANPSSAKPLWTPRPIPWSAPDPRYSSPFTNLTGFNRELLETNPQGAYSQFTGAVAPRAGTPFSEWLQSQYRNEYARYQGLASKYDPGLYWLDYLNNRAPDLYRAFEGFAPSLRGERPGGGSQNLYRF